MLRQDYRAVKRPKRVERHREQEIVVLDASPDRTLELRNAFGCFASGVTVVTLHDDDGAPTGITVNSFSSLSLDPALLLFSIGKSQVSARFFEAREAFNVNVLCRDQEHLAWQFAKPLKDKFKGVDVREAQNGVPVIDGALAHFVCEKHEVLEGGDHLIIVGRIVDFAAREGEPLLFNRGRMCSVAPAP